VGAHVVGRLGVLLAVRSHSSRTYGHGRPGVWVRL
jgi:hypothetical protein